MTKSKDSKQKKVPPYYRICLFSENTGVIIQMLRKEVCEDFKMPIAN